MNLDYMQKEYPSALFCTLNFLATDWFILFFFPNMWSYSGFTSHVVH
jgi:hypothetical protein